MKKFASSWFIYKDYTEMRGQQYTKDIITA
jgi:hypothetical protein